MVILNFIRIAWRNVFLASRRTMLLGFSLAGVACLFILLRGLGGGISARMIESATALSAGHVNIGGFFKQRAKSFAPLVAERDRVRQVTQAALPNARLVDRNRGWGRLVGPKSSLNAAINGIDAAQEQRFFKALTLAPESDYVEGGDSRVLGSLDDLGKVKDSLLLFAGQAKKLGIKVGDPVTIVAEATGGETNSIDLTVVAVAKDLGMLSNWAAFTPKDTVNRLNHVKDTTTGVVMVYLDDIEQAESAMATLRTALGGAGFQIMDHDPNPYFMKFERVMGEDWLGQKLDLTIWKDEISFVSWVNDALALLTFLIVSILSIIVAAGIANAMWMSVQERVKEIGTMRAMGARRFHILFVFLFEAGLLSLVFVGCTSIGMRVLISVINWLNIPITNAGLKMFLLTDSVYLKVSIGQLILTVIFFCFVAMAGAFFPALKAARLRPVEALRQGK